MSRSDPGSALLICIQDAPQLPTLLAIALPQLPPPLPSLITNGFAYLKIGSVFLDDIAALLVGIGLFIWVAGWITDV